MPVNVWPRNLKLNWPIAEAQNLCVPFLFTNSFSNLAPCSFQGTCILTYTRKMVLHTLSRTSGVKNTHPTLVDALGLHPSQSIDGRILLHPSTAAFENSALQDLPTKTRCQKLSNSQDSIGDSLTLHKRYRRNCAKISIKRCNIMCRRFTQVMKNLQECKVTESAICTNPHLRRVHNPLKSTSSQ